MNCIPPGFGKSRACSALASVAPGFLPSSRCLAQPPSHPSKARHASSELAFDASGSSAGSVASGVIAPRRDLAQRRDARPEPLPRRLDGRGDARSDGASHGRRLALAARLRGLVEARVELVSEREEVSALDLGGDLNAGVIVVAHRGCHHFLRGAPRDLASPHSTHHGGKAIQVFTLTPRCPSARPRRERSCVPGGGGNQNDVCLSVVRGQRETVVRVSPRRWWRPRGGWKRLASGRCGPSSPCAPGASSAISTWGTCTSGSTTCASPPSSPTDYSFFRTGSVLTTTGEVPVGQITMGTGHANLRLNASRTIAHYDNTGTVVADVQPGRTSTASGSVEPSEPRPLPIRSWPCAARHCRAIGAPFAVTWSWSRRLPSTSPASPSLGSALPPPEGSSRRWLQPVSPSRDCPRRRSTSTPSSTECCRPSVVGSRWRP